MMNKQKRFKYLLPLLLCAVSILIVLSIFVGSVGLKVNDVVLALLGRGSEQIQTIVLELRLPRAVVAMFVGATLSLSGAIIKAVMKNPLADTGILGIQSGATVTALIILLIYPSMYTMLPIAAFVGGLIAYIIIMILSYKRGYNPLRLILAGVAVNALFGSMIGLITIYNSDEIQNALGWLNGSFTSVNMADMKLIMAYGTIAIIIGLLIIPQCNLLLLDDETISNIGYNVNLIRFVIATIAVFISSISVSVVGIIGFVGLVCPHIARLLVGNNYKYMLPISMLLGSILVMSADVLQKVIFAPAEIPVGIVISFLGAPFFLYLLRREV